MTWPRLRGSPLARAVSAAALSAANTAMPSLTGSNAPSQVMVSGAGRTETWRSDSARRRRSATASTSSSAASLRACAAASRSPMPSTRAGSPEIVASTMMRSSRDRHEVSCASRDALYSVILPARRAAAVHVISSCSTRASRRWRRPRWGDSRRASAICSAIPRPRRSAGTPRCSATARWEFSNSAATWACAPSAAHFSSSNARIRSIRAASSSASSPRARAAVHSATLWASTSSGAATVASSRIR